MQMSYAKLMKMSSACVFFALAFFVMNACTASNDAVSVEASENSFSPSGNSEKGNSGDSSDKEKDTEKADTEDEPSVEVAPDFDEIFKDYAKYLTFKKISSMAIKFGTVKFSVNSFYISSNEVTQALYKSVMNTIPKQGKENDSLPVIDVSWFDAVLFCNALAKEAGFDTAYVYKSIGDKNYLEELSINYNVPTIRLPTEIEWEVAAHGETTTRFYWGDDKASDYAYYGQTNGPAKVGGYKPNSYGLYDMSGNVAEWVNDWYGAYPTSDTKNPTGAKTGSSRTVRGGGWADKVAAIAPRERDKKDPLYHATTLGFRIVYSNGF